MNYYSLKRLYNTKKIEIHQEWLWELKLEKSLLNKLALYLSNENELSTDEYFDCASFANYIKWVEYSGNQFEPSRYDFLPFWESWVEVWDIVYTWMKNDVDDIISENTSVHYMVYLGEGLYLSKFGRSGRLIVTALEEYGKIYPSAFLPLLQHKN